MSFGEIKQNHSKMDSIKSMYSSQTKSQNENNMEDAFEYVQRLEGEITKKDKEIKLIKGRLVKDQTHISPVNVYNNNR